MKPPLDVLPLFPVLNDSLIQLLSQLSIEDWQRPTVAKKWVIKDVATHLLDGNFRRIALNRDKWFLPPDREIRSYQDLVDFLNEINADWVKATKRLSPRILVELLDSTNKEVYQLFSRLDPFSPSAYPVSWAGEDLSRNWFDLAREYTERWHHQQQIRDALGDSSIMTKQLYGPLLDTFFYAWPHALNGTKAEEGTILKATITGEGGGGWFVKMENNAWRLTRTVNGQTAIKAETIIDGSIAWKLFSKSLRKQDVPGSFEIRGEQQLGEIVLDMVSVMA